MMVSTIHLHLMAMINAYTAPAIAKAVVIQIAAWDALIATHCLKENA